MSLHDRLAAQAKKIEAECAKLYNIKAKALKVCAVKRQYSHEHLKELYDAIEKLEIAIRESYECGDTNTK